MRFHTVVVSVVLLMVWILAAAGVQAGDCPTHPWILREIEVKSCAPLSIENAGKVSVVAPPSVVVARYPGVVLEAMTIRRKEVDLGDPKVKPKSCPWATANTKELLLYASKDADACTRFVTGTKVKVAYLTDCECDTGPEADGYCALTVEQVRDVPPELEAFAR